MLEKLSQLPRSLFVLYAGTTITRLGAFVFPYLTIYLTEARGYGVNDVGLILSVGAIGLLAGNLAGGWLADRWSRKWTLVLALIINAIGFGGLAPHYDAGWMYAVFLAIGYVGSGMYTPAANTVIADVTDVHIRPFAYTVNYVCINFGMAAGPLAAGFLATVSYSWIFIGDVATSLICAALIAMYLRHTMRRAPATPGDGRLASFSPTIWSRQPLVMAFCLAYFFMICPLMGLEYSVPLLVKTVFLEELSFVGAVYTVNAVCILALSFIIERVVRRRNEFMMMLVSGMFWTLGLTILLTGWSVAALLVCTAVWTVGEIIGSILVPTYIARHVAPDVKGRFMALNDVVRSFAGVICPIGLGLVWAASGPVTVIALLLALPVCGMLCYLLLAALASKRRYEASASPLAAEL